MLPVIEAVVNGKNHMALMDSRCSRSLVTGLVCNPWSWQASDVLTVDGKILDGNGIRTIMPAVDNVSPMKANVLVVDSSLLSFNMVISMDIIKMLGRVHINQSSDAIFPRMELCACTAIRIEEPEISAKFNE